MGSVFENGPIDTSISSLSRAWQVHPIVISGESVNRHMRTCQQAKRNTSEVVE